MWTGIFFDHVDLAGLPGVQINKLDPHSRAKLSVNRLSLAKADGQKLVNANYENKVIKIEGTIRGNSREQFEERYQNFFKYINTKEALLQIPQAGNMLNYIATAEETSWTDDQVGTWGQFSVTFVASTPYGENPNYTTATNAVGITTASSTELIVPAIQGSYKASPLITVTLTNFSTANVSDHIKVINEATGKYIKVTRVWTIGDVLVIDNTAKTVKVNGTDVDFSGVFLDFEPGTAYVGQENSFSVHRTLTLKLEYKRRDL